MELPIDIHSGKLLEWLISRRHCSQTWNKEVIKIREKINAAIQDMPPVEEITKLLSGSYINYFHCQRIVELLAETTDGQRNLFGQYSSSRMKDWKEIMNLYEKNAIFLAESSQLLQRNVTYEVPALKKNISRLQQAQTDCIKKQNDYLSNSAEMKNKFKVKCEKIGIKGDNIKLELVNMAADLPTKFSEIVESCKKLDPAISYQRKFVKFTSDEDDTSSFRTLCHISEKGDTTVYEYRRGEIPSSIENTVDVTSKYCIETSNDNQETTEIDWGDEDAEIDFGDEDEKDIDWGIESEDKKDDINTALNTDGVARGIEALSLLDYSETRENFINELMQLQSFMSQRIVEIDSTTMLEPAAGLPHLYVEKSQISVWLANVTRMVSSLTNSHTIDLLQIRSSQKYVERLADKLEKIRQESVKLVSRSEMMVTNKNNFQNEQVNLACKCDVIKSNTVILKKQIESVISKKYKGRIVNIMGEINSM